MVGIREYDSITQIIPHIIINKLKQSDLALFT